jgi:XTP/dITP diphosphohydrolase
MSAKEKIQQILLLLTSILHKFFFMTKGNVRMPNNEFIRFVQITKRLRKECPWDKEQTHASIRHSLIEEAYEVVETIDNNNLQELKNELGDILLHVAFHSNIAEEEQEFTLRDVIEGITEKLIRRHPHIFGEATAGTAEQVKQNWEKLKMQEGRTSLMDGVPKELPALLRAHRLTDKASKVGFDWKKREDAWKKVEEETNELHEILENGTPEATEEEFGDLLFALVNYSRFINVNPENALRRTIEKFITRFQYIEVTLKNAGKDIHSSTLEEMDVLWNEAKNTSG